MSYDDRLLEISYGMWDGQKNADLERRYPEVFDHKLHDVLPSYAPLAMGETFEKVQERVGAFTKSMVKRYPGEQLVIVTHGFTIKLSHSMCCNRRIQWVYRNLKTRVWQRLPWMLKRIKCI